MCFLLSFWSLKFDVYINKKLPGDVFIVLINSWIITMSSHIYFGQK